MASHSNHESSAATRASTCSSISGFIRPPSGVREVVDKTAAFVSKAGAIGGAAFEEKIRASDSSDKKFAFLVAGHPYYAYYRHRVAELLSRGTSGAAMAAGSDECAMQVPSAGEQAFVGGAAVEQAPVHATTGIYIAHKTEGGTGGGSASAQAGGVNVSTIVASRGADLSAAHPVAAALRALGDAVSQPTPPKEFSPPHPPHLFFFEIEAIKLAAQFTAVQGKPFLTMLAMQQEARADAATASAAAAPPGAPSPVQLPAAYEFLRPSHAAFGYFTALVDEYHRILHPPVALLTRLRADAGAGAAGRARAALLTRCVHRLEHARREEARRAVSSERSLAAFVDWHDCVLVETISFENNSDAVAGVGNAVAAAAPASERGLQTAAAAPTGAGEAISIRRDYMPSLGSATSSMLTGYLDKRTGQQLSLDEASEHLRVDLLDPKWLEERAVFLARREGTLYAAGDEIADNLRSLAAARADVFGARPSFALGAPLAKRARSEGDDPPGA